jgi:thiamine-phosphate pyrophosphorylase
LLDQGVYQVVDANTNRVSEGLRVIEEFLRFVVRDRALTDLAVGYRRHLNRLSAYCDYGKMMAGRNTERDMRAKEAPSKRSNMESLLRANFKRVTEGLRVLEEYLGNAEFNVLRYDVYEFEKSVFSRYISKKIGKGVYLVSDDVDVLKKGVLDGVPICQLRDKSGSKSDILEKAHLLKKFCETTNTLFIVNDFIDIALAVDSDGFHSGQDDISVVELKKILGPYKIIGRTTHDISQGMIAEREGADYISVGPIWETPSKPGREGIGFNYLEEVRGSVSIPFVVIGGINSGNVGKLLPFDPPLIGLIRASEDIPRIHELMGV